MSADALEALLDKLNTGDMEAAQQVFVTYEPYLRKVVRRQLPAWLRPKFDTADVVQSTWVGLIEGFRETQWHFADADHLRAFLVKVVRNRFVDRVRRYHTAAEREQPLESTDPAALPPGDEPRPSQKAEANELWERMLRLCPEEHHEILRLRREGVPVPDIAARIGLHEDSIHRILRQLARRLAFAEKAGPAAHDGP
jgi:RNA polymerase sigma-70 factor (ECF subfamily)